MPGIIFSSKIDVDITADRVMTTVRGTKAFKTSAAFAFSGAPPDYFSEHCYDHTVEWTKRNERTQTTLHEQPQGYNHCRRWAVRAHYCPQAQTKRAEKPFCDPGEKRAGRWCHSLLPGKWLSRRDRAPRLPGQLPGKQNTARGNRA